MQRLLGMPDEVQGTSPFIRRARRVIALVALTTIALLVLRYCAQEIFVLFAGVLFGVALRTVSAWTAEKTKVPYKAVVAAFALLLVVAGVVGAALIGPDLAEQGRNLIGQIPKAYHQLLARAQSQPIVQEVVKTPHDPQPLLGDQAKTIVTGATNIAEGVVAAIGALAIVFFVGLYGALDPRGYVRPVLSLVPPARRARVDEVLGLIGDNLARWLLGRLVAMTFVGVLTTVALLLMKIPLALGLGVVAGLLTFVEYVGAVSAGALVGLMALTKSPIDAVWIVALFTFVHVIEGYVLTPILARKTVHFPPGYTLAAQVILGAIYGPLGLTFATPLGVVVILLVQKLYVEDVLGDRAEPADEGDRAAPRWRFGLRAHDRRPPDRATTH